MSRVVPKLSQEVEDFNYLKDLVRRQIINLVDDNRLEEIMLFLVENPFFTKEELINLNLSEKKVDEITDSLLKDNIILVITFNNKKIYSNKNVIEYFTKHNKVMNTKFN